MFAGDADRERAATELREHYVRGRLSLEEYSRRVERALAARSHGELRATFAGLTSWPDARGLVHGAARGVALVLFTGLYFVFSFVLLLVLAVTLLLHGATTTALLGFLAVWLVPTYLLSRLWHRPRRHS
jgi:Flp pilus assembly protein TadB